MMSIVLITIFFASAAGASKVTPKVQLGMMPSRRAPAPAMVGYDSGYECGICGGAVEGCPNCRGPSFFDAAPNTAVAHSLPGIFNVLGESELDIDNRYACGMCGGTAEGCPMCRGPTQVASILLDTFDPLGKSELSWDPAGFVQGKSDLEVDSSYECGMCGGAVEGCPNCRGPTPASFEALNAVACGCSK